MTFSYIRGGLPNGCINSKLIGLISSKLPKKREAIAKTLRKVSEAQEEKFNIRSILVVLFLTIGTTRFFFFNFVVRSIYCLEEYNLIVFFHSSHYLLSINYFCFFAGNRFVVGLKWQFFQLILYIYFILVLKKKKRYICIRSKNSRFIGIKSSIILL